MSSGAVTIGQIARRLDRLAVACSKCGRQGSHSVHRLIERHGPDLGLPDLAVKLSVDCERHGPMAYDRCQVHFPDLRK